MSRRGGGRLHVESVARKLVLPVLLDEGLLDHPKGELVVSWGRDLLTVKADLDVAGGFGSLWLEHDGGALRYRVYLATTRPHFGGQRWWLVCPHTGRRCLTLYRPGKRYVFASRQHYRLTFASTCKSPSHRTLDRLFALRDALDPDASRLEAPGRPWGMWERTYQRRLAVLERYEHAANGSMLLNLLRIAGKTPAELLP